MFVEMDEVAVEAGLWARVKAGDGAARAELRKKLDGLVLYMHALSIGPHVGDAAPGQEAYELLTIRQLEGANAVDYVTLGQDDGGSRRPYERAAAEAERVHFERTLDCGCGSMIAEAIRALGAKEEG